MQKYIIIVSIIFITSCTNQFNKNSRFNKEQIASLQLDSTAILNVETDSLININLNSFIQKQSFELGSLIKEIKLVPLETTNESLLDIIYKILVTDSNIYIHDRLNGGGLVFFNKEGKFIKRIPNGQGPGELVRLYDIAYDMDNNELIAYQHSFLLFFTSSGEYIRQMRLPFGFYSLMVIPNGYVFKILDRQGNEHLGRLEDYTLFVADKNFMLKSVAMPYQPSNINFGGHNYLYNNDNAITITQRFVDTIYQYRYETNHFKSRFVLNYNKKKLPEHYLKGTMKEFDNAISQNDYYYYIGEYLETTSQNVFFLRNDYTGLQSIIYRDKKTGNLIGGTHAIYDDVNEIPPMTFPLAAVGNYFISIHFPNKNDVSLSNSSMISNEDKIKIKNLNEDDNPVLVFFQLKDF